MNYNPWVWVMDRGEVRYFLSYCICLKGGKSKNKRNRIWGENFLGRRYQPPQRPWGWCECGQRKGRQGGQCGWSTVDDERECHTRSETQGSRPCRASGGGRSVGFTLTAEQEPLESYGQRWGRIF